MSGRLIVVFSRESGAPDPRRELAVARLDQQDMHFTSVDVQGAVLLQSAIRPENGSLVLYVQLGQ